MVFIINNNQWAISVASTAQTHCQTFAQKAIAGGLPGFQVDGNDVLAVYDVTQKALADARAGKGATVIEALTYRLCDHTTADDASRYQPKEQIAMAWSQEPIERLKRFMMQQFSWDETQDQTLKQLCQAQVEAAVTEYLHTPTAPISDMFDYLYATLPKALNEQRETALYYGAEYE